MSNEPRTVTEALQELISAVAACPDALMNGNGDLAQRELYRWWWGKAAPALQGARKALATASPQTASPGEGER